MRTAAASFDELHRAAAGEVTSLRQAQALEQGQAALLVKQAAALKRDNHLLKVRPAAWNHLQWHEGGLLPGKSCMCLPQHGMIDCPRGQQKWHLLNPKCHDPFLVHCTQSGCTSRQGDLPLPCCSTQTP